MSQDSDAPLQRLATAIAAMPPLVAMRVGVLDYDGGRLSLGAPLAPNVNDKGCAFGGSLAGLMTIAAWGLIAVKLAEEGIQADTYVQDSQLRYLAPVFTDLVAEAWLAPEDSWPHFLRKLAARGKARARLVARVRLPDGGDAATFEGRFVALRAA